MGFCAVQMFPCWEPLPILTGILLLGVHRFTLTGEWWTSFNTKPEAQQHRFAISLYTLSKYFSYGKSAWNFPFEKKSIHQQYSGETMGNLYPARGGDTDCVVFVKQVHFSYSESPRTPPIDWTSLHWRTYSVDLEPVYDLHPITNSPCQRLWHRHNVSSFFFLFSHFCIYLFFLHFFFFFFSSSFFHFFLLHFFVFSFFFSRSFFLRWITADPSPWGNFTPPAKQ